MKKAIIFLTVAFLSVGALSAQNWKPRNAPDQKAPEAVKIDGTLQLYKGQFAVASGNNIYYVPIIARYIGFIDSLKEGANVTFEGYVSGNMLMPLKMTISGKTYELADSNAFGNRQRSDRNNRNDRNFGRVGPGFGPGGPGTSFYGPGFGRNR